MASRASVYLSFGLMPYITSWWFHTLLRRDSIPQASCGFHTRLRRDLAQILAPRFYAMLIAERRWGKIPRTCSEEFFYLFTLLSFRRALTRKIRNRERMLRFHWKTLFYTIIWLLSCEGE
jgi:hypothetical protein